MRIVIDPRQVFNNGFSVEDRRYISGCLAMLAKEKPQVEFCLLTNQKRMITEFAEVRATTISLKSSFSTFPGVSFLAARDLSKAIRGQKADILFTIGTPAGRDFGLPECCWLFESHLPGFKKPAIVKLVKSLLFTGSGDLQSLMSNNNQGIGGKTLAVPISAEEPTFALTWTEKENLKVKYAGGREFFITRSYFSEEDLMVVLKAFSRFKKKQQSNMQLLITGMKSDQYQAGFEKLDSYKFRNDVHVYPSLDANVFQQTTAAAYALIQPGNHTTGMGMLNALQMQVPVIVAEDPKIKEIGASSVLYATAGDYDSFSDQMSLVFKDEILRGDVIRKGKMQAQKFTPQQSISAIWNGLMRSLPEKMANSQ